MRHSLLSRFQGTLLAAALGDELGACGQLRQEQCKTGASGRIALPVALAKGGGWYPGLELERNAPARQPSPGGKAASCCTHALVQAGGWSEGEIAAIGVYLATHKAMVSMPERVQAGKPSRETLLAAELTIAALPLTLFFHDDETRQQQRLLQAASLWNSPTGAEAGVLAVGYAIAQALKERLESLTLLPQIIAYLKQGTATPTTLWLDLTDALEHVQTLVRQGAALRFAIERLQLNVAHPSNRAIALAFYCFLSTPDDLRLALMRAALCHDAVLVGTLTGALSGAYNGYAGLPLIWRLAEGSMPLWGWSTSKALIHQLATHLFAVWSGVYDLTAQMDTFAIAAPGVIRFR